MNIVTKQATCPECGSHDVNSLETVVARLPIHFAAGHDGQWETVAEGDVDVSTDGDFLTYQCDDCQYESTDEADFCPPERGRKEQEAETEGQQRGKHELD